MSTLLFLPWYLLFLHLFKYDSCLKLFFFKFPYFICSPLSDQPEVANNNGCWRIWKDLFICSLYSVIVIERECGGNRSDIVRCDMSLVSVFRLSCLALNPFLWFSSSGFVLLFECYFLFIPVLLSLFCHFARKSFLNYTPLHGIGSSTFSDIKRTVADRTAISGVSLSYMLLLLHPPIHIITLRSIQSHPERT